MNFLMIEQLINIFKCFSALMKEARIFIARNFVFEDVHVVSCGEGQFDSALLLILVPHSITRRNFSLLTSLMPVMLLQTITNVK